MRGANLDSRQGRPTQIKKLGSKPHPPFPPPFLKMPDTPTNVMPCHEHSPANLQSICQVSNFMQGSPVLPSTLLDVSGAVPQEVVQKLLEACKTPSFDNIQEAAADAIADGWPVCPMLPFLFFKDQYSGTINQCIQGNLIKPYSLINISFMWIFTHSSVLSRSLTVIESLSQDCPAIHMCVCR